MFYIFISLITVAGASQADLHHKVLTCRSETGYACDPGGCYERTAFSTYYIVDLDAKTHIYFCDKNKCDKVPVNFSKSGIFIYILYSSGIMKISTQDLYFSNDSTLLFMNFLSYGRCKYGS